MLDVTSFKEILGKASPGIEQVAPVTVLAIERLTTEFLNSRIFSRHKGVIVQSVVRGVQAFLKIEEIDCKYSWLARRAVIKNLENSKSIWIKTWHLPEQEVQEAIKEGCESFLKKVMEENQ
jgi:hypothetical protein